MIFHLRSVTPQKSSNQSPLTELLSNSYLLHVSLDAIFLKNYPCSGLKVFSFVVESGVRLITVEKGLCYPEAQEHLCTGISEYIFFQVHFASALSRPLAKSWRLSDIFAPRSFISHWIKYEAYQYNIDLGYLPRLGCLFINYFLQRIVPVYRCYGGVEIFPNQRWRSEIQDLLNKSARHPISEFCPTVLHIHNNSAGNKSFQLVPALCGK